MTGVCVVVPIVGRSVFVGTSRVVLPLPPISLGFTRRLHSGTPGDVGFKFSEASSQPFYYFGSRGRQSPSSAVVKSGVGDWTFCCDLRGVHQGLRGKSSMGVTMDLVKRVGKRLPGK